VNERELHPHAKRILRTVSFQEATAAAVPQLRRGKVWCLKCGNEQDVNAAQCLRSGWPKCCGETMTIDSPEERAGRAGRR